MDEQNGLPELPKGWISTTLGNVVLSTRPKVMPNNFPNLQYVGLEHIEAHTTKLLGSVLATTMRSQAVHFFPKDVLYSRLRPYLNKVASLDFEGLCSSEFIVFPQNDSLLSEYLLYFLNQYAFVSFANGLNEGDRPRVDLSQIGVYPFPLPPLNEQARIVAKIEELFTKLDAGIDALRAIQKQIKRYRQAVLRDAVTGELTRAWREENQAELEPADALLKRILTERRDRWEQEQLKKFAESGKPPKNADWKKKYKEPAAPSTENLPELPNHWTWASVIQIGFVISGQTPKGIENISQKGNVHWYKVGDMNNKGNEKYMRNASTLLTEDEVANLKLNIQPENTIIFPKRGGAIATNKKRIVSKPSGYDLNIMGISPFGVNHSYIWNWFASINLATLGDGSNVPQINHGDIEPLPTPLPPLAEQQKIVEEVERLLSVADAVEVTVKQSLKQAERLRQSILKRAFEGKLVPQDDADEPAEILLERIKREREEQGKSKKATGKKTHNKSQAKTVLQGELPL